MCTGFNSTHIEYLCLSASTIIKKETKGTKQYEFSWRLDYLVSIVSFVARNLCLGTYRTNRIFVWNGMKLQHAVCIINVWACAEILPA